MQWLLILFLVALVGSGATFYMAQKGAIESPAITGGALVVLVLTSAALLYLAVEDWGAHSALIR